jgi:hypothetical protein
MRRRNDHRLATVAAMKKGKMRETRADPNPVGVSAVT